MNQREQRKRQDQADFLRAVAALLDDCGDAREAREIIEGVWADRLLKQATGNRIEGES